MIQADRARDDPWFLRGVIIPLGIIVLAVLVFVEGGEQGSLGPLNLATVNIVVAGLWGLGPAIGGLLARPLSGDDRRRSIAIVGCVLGVAIGLVCLTAAGTGDDSSCATAAAPNVFAYILGSLGVGAAVGVGSSLAMWLAGILNRGRTWVPGLSLGWAVGVLALVVPLSLYFNTVSCYH